MLCQIDWSLLKDILGSIAAIVVAVAAWQGINTWRNELVGKSQFAVAKNVLSLALQFRDDYRLARSPQMTIAEAEDTVFDPRDTPQHREYLAQIHVRGKRITALNSTLEKLELACRDA